MTTSTQLESGIVPVSSTRSGFSGISYSDEIPVNSAISPARARRNRHLTSRASQTSIGQEQYISASVGTRQIAHKLAINTEKRYERCQRHDAGLNKQLRHFADSAKILCPVFPGKTQIRTQAVPDVVTIEDKSPATSLI